ncbi:hypothetical protein H6F32_02490 [Anabaena sp. FACHB-1237]|uniref:hypothetical protein n=1 Tax=Anabaena sp. FACHB-1237 TaxID=2692769 RepID=UPI001680C57E|nr:hypothetical protein [Anabaena sp. FACHB-1237]MBD2136477.1 hypothetical protein [Anabaena sp. FACHB-1237]
MLIVSSLNIRKISNSLVLGLALSSLLTPGLVITSSESALAIPQPQEQQVNHYNNHYNLAKKFSSQLPNRIEQAIIKDAAKRATVKSSQVKITQVTPTTFGNRCIFKFNDICTKEYNPISGWIVVVNVQDQSWTYHVNKPGSQILLDPKISSNQLTKLPKNLANIVLKDAAKRSNLPLNAVKITQATDKTFSNSCVFNFGEVCTQQYDPVFGWEVIVDAQGKSWIYHIDKTGTKLGFGGNK